MGGDKNGESHKGLGPWTGRGGGLGAWRKGGGAGTSWYHALSPLVLTFLLLPFNIDN